MILLQNFSLPLIYAFNSLANGKTHIAHENNLWRECVQKKNDLQIQMKNGFDRKKINENFPGTAAVRTNNGNIKRFHLKYLFKWKRMWDVRNAVSKPKLYFEISPNL